jgi:hypothetical protein
MSNPRLISRLDFMASKGIILRSGLCVALIFMCSCSLVRNQSTTHYEDGEGVFSGLLLESIEPKSTSEEWMLKHFGDPSFSRKIDENTRLLTWPFMVEIESRRRIFPFYDSSKKYQEPRYLHSVVAGQQVLVAWVSEEKRPNKRTTRGAMEKPKPISIKKISANSQPENTPLVLGSI